MLYGAGGFFVSRRPRENPGKMMNETITIAVDALGGDAGPRVVLPGVALALAARPNLEVILCGPEEVVESFAREHDRCHAQVTTEEILMGEHPAAAVRKKKDSSLVVGCRLVKEGTAQGFFSAGSTGAVLAAATMVTGRIKGVARPALATVLPSPTRNVILCDCGANADCRPEYLLQFAQMAGVYAEKVLEREHPRIALLNIGSEDSKGNKLAQEAFELLRANLPQFAGNAEGTDVLAGTYDVYVTDGFTGNVCLKTIEGTARSLMGALGDAFKTNARTKLAAGLVAHELRALKRSMSADETGAAPLLGVRGAVMVGHGSSNEQAIKNGILTSAKTVELRVSEIIAQTISPQTASGTMV